MVFFAEKGKRFVLMNRLRKRQEVAGKVGATEPPPQQQQQQAYYYQQQDFSQQQQPSYSAGRNSGPPPAPSSNYQPPPQSYGGALPPSAPPAYLASQLQSYQSPYAMPNTSLAGGGHEMMQTAADGGGQQLPSFLVESPRRQQLPTYGGPTFNQSDMPTSTLAPPREVYSAQAPLRPAADMSRQPSNGTLAAFGNENDGLPKFGRRARTTDGGPRNDAKEERTLRYQQEIREQKEAAEAKKKADRERERQQDIIFEQKMLEDQRKLAEKERAEQAKERQERDDREAAKFGGRRDKNKTSNQKQDGDDSLQNELMKQIEEKKARKAEEEKRKMEEDLKYEERHRRQLQGGVQQQQQQGGDLQPSASAALGADHSSAWDPSQNQPRQHQDGGATTPVFLGAGQPSMMMQQPGVGGGGGGALPPWVVGADQPPVFNQGPSPYFHPVDPALARQPNPRYPTTTSSLFSPTAAYDQYGNNAATSSPLFAGAPSPMYPASAYPPNFGAHQQQQQVAVNNEVSALRSEILGLLTQQQLGAGGGGGVRPYNMGSTNTALPQSAVFVPVGQYSQPQMMMMYGSNQQPLVNPNDVLGQFMRDESAQYGGGMQQPNVFASHAGNVSTNFLPLNGGGGGGGGGGGAFDNFLQGYQRGSGVASGPQRGGGAGGGGGVDVSMELGSEPSQFVRLRR